MVQGAGFSLGGGVVQVIRGNQKGGTSTPLRERRQRGGSHSTACLSAADTSTSSSRTHSSVLLTHPSKLHPLPSSTRRAVYANPTPQPDLRQPITRGLAFLDTPPGPGSAGQPQESRAGRMSPTLPRRLQQQQHIPRSPPCPPAPSAAFNAFPPPVEEPAWRRPPAYQKPRASPTAPTSAVVCEVKAPRCCPCAPVPREAPSPPVGRVSPEPASRALVVAAASPEEGGGGGGGGRDSHWQGVALSLRDEVASLRSQVTTLRSTVDTVQSRDTELQTELAYLKGRLRAVEVEQRVAEGPGFPQQRRFTQPGESGAASPIPRSPPPPAPLQGSPPPPQQHQGVRELSPPPPPPAVVGECRGPSLPSPRLFSADRALSMASCVEREDYSQGQPAQPPIFMPPPPPQQQQQQQQQQQCGEARPHSGYASPPAPPGPPAALAGPTPGSFRQAPPPPPCPERAAVPQEVVGGLSQRSASPSVAPLDRLALGARWSVSGDACGDAAGGGGGRRPPQCPSPDVAGVAGAVAAEPQPGVRQGLEEARDDSTARCETLVPEESGSRAPSSSVGASVAASRAGSAAASLSQQAPSRHSSQMVQPAQEAAELPCSLRRESSSGSSRVAHSMGGVSSRRSSHATRESSPSQHPDDGVKSQGLEAHAAPEAHHSGRTHSRRGSELSGVSGSIPRSPGGVAVSDMRREASRSSTSTRRMSEVASQAEDAKSVVSVAAPASLVSRRSSQSSRRSARERRASGTHAGSPSSASSTRAPHSERRPEADTPVAMSPDDVEIAAVISLGNSPEIAEVQDMPSTPAPSPQRTPHGAFAAAETPRTQPPTPQPVQIRVEDLDGHSLFLMLHRSETVGCVKRHVQEAWGHPSASQRIIFGGRALLDDETLRGCGVVERGAILHLLADGIRVAGQSSASEAASTRTSSGSGRRHTTTPSLQPSSRSSVQATHAPRSVQRGTVPRWKIIVQDLVGSSLALPCSAFSTVFDVKRIIEVCSGVRRAVPCSLHRSPGGMRRTNSASSSRASSCRTRAGFVRVTMSDDDMVRFGDKIEIDMDGMSEPAKASLRAAVEEADSMGDELKRLADAYNALLEEAEMKNMLLREKEGVIEDLRRAEADDVGSLKKRQGAVINDLRNALEAKEAASHQQAQELQMVQHEAFTLQNAVSALKMEGRETDQEHSREVEDLSMRISRLSAEASEKTSTITAMNFEHRTLTDNALMQQKENADLRRIIGKLKADLELTKRNNDNDERSLHHEVDHLRGVLERMEKSRADLECEASEARLRERQLANTADKLQGDLNCAKLRHSTEMEGARRVWDDEKRLLERNIMDRKEEAAMLDANAARNRREIQNLYQELDDARDQCAEAERRERERKAEVDRLQEDMRALSQMMRSETTRLQDEAEEAAMKQRHSALQLQQAKGEISTLKNEKSVLELAQSELELDNTRLAEDVERLKRELDATRQCEAKLRVEVKKLEMILSQKDALNESLRRKLHEGVRGMAAERQDVEKLTDAMQKVTDRLRVANLEIEEIFVNDGDNDEEGTGGDDEETGQGTSSASIFGQSRADLSRAGNLQQSMADLRAAFDEDHDEYEPACLPDEVAKVEGFGDQLLALIQMHKWEHQDRVQSSKDDMSSMLDQKNAAIKNLEDQIRMMQGELRQLHASTAAAHEMEQAEEMDRRVIDRQEHAEFATIEMQKREADHYLTRQRMHALEDWEARARRQVVEGEAAAFNAILLNRDLKYERQRANAAENMLLLMQQEERARAAIKEAEDTAANAFGGSIAVVKTMHGEARKRNLEGEEEELRDDINDHENADREMLVLQFKLEEEKRKVEEGLRMRRAMQDKHELVGWEEAERRDIQDDEERCFEVICECVAGVKVQYITGLIYELEYDEANARLDIEDLEEGEWNLILHDADLDFEQMIEKLRKKRLRELRAKQKKTAYMGIQVSDGITIRGASGTETHFREREQVSKLLKEGVPVKGLNKHAAAQRSMEGVKVFNVAPNGPSDLAGISSDDVILSFNGLHTRGLSDFKSVAKKVKPGEIVNFTVWREGEEVAVPVQTVEVNEDDFEQGLRRKIGHRITVMRGMKEERTRQREARRRELRVDRVPAVHTSVPRDHVIDPAATHSLAGANAGPMTNGMFVRSKRLNQALAADYHDEMAAEDAPAERPLTACPPSPRETRGSNISPQPHLSKPKLWRK